MATKIHPSAPYYPPKISSEIAYAVQGLSAGKADAHQQSLFLQWLIVEVCKKDDISYRPGPDGQRDTDFAEGKRFVAISVLRALNQTPEMIANLRMAEQAEAGLPITEGDEIGRHE